MTTEQQIIDQIDINLRAISIANGYSFDVGANVWEWLDVNPEAGDIPGITYRDVSDEVVVEEDEQEHRLHVAVTLWDSGINSPASIRAKKQDVITAMSLLEQQDFIAGIVYTGSEKTVERGDQRVAQVTLNFEVDYFTDVFKI